MFWRNFSFCYNNSPHSVGDNDCCWIHCSYILCKNCKWFNGSMVNVSLT